MGRVHIWTARTGELVFTIDLDREATVWRLTFDSDGQRLLICGGVTESVLVQWWSLNSKSPLKKICFKGWSSKGPAKGGYAIGLYQGRPLAVFTDANKQSKLWDVLADAPFIETCAVSEPSLELAPYEVV